MFDLIVTQPFRGYAKGDRIADQDQVTRYLAGPNRHHVVKVAAASQADPAPAPAAEPPRAPVSPPPPPAALEA